MSPSVSVFGLGYVGTVTAACLAHKGHNVIGVDLNLSKVEALHTGHSPVVEPRVEGLIAEGHATGRLSATANSEDAVLNSEISSFSAWALEVCVMGNSTWVISSRFAGTLDRS